MQILLTTLLLVSNALELDLASLLQSRLDVHLQDLILCSSLACNLIKDLPLDAHLLMCTIVQLLERQI